MKYFKILSIVLFSLVISFYSCNDTPKTSKQDNSNPVNVSEGATTTPNAKIPNITDKEPAQNDGGVWHYTCSKGCAGGAGSAVACENCGGILAHNTTYHSKPNDTPTSTSTSPFATPTPTAEPSINSAGVWHYTCSQGCAGGAGAAGSCGTCGGALAHNGAYHQ